MEREGVNEVAIAWAAGVFEGEGSFARPSGRASLQITNCDKDVLHRFQQICGGRVYGPYTYEGKDGCRRKPFYQWNIEGFDAHTVLKLLAPYLSERRLQQAREFIPIYGLPLRPVDFR